jgi:hypothetical protein
MEALKIPETSRFLLENWFAIEITLAVQNYIFTFGLSLPVTQKWA